MKIPIKYNLGNLSARRVSTGLSILGIGIVLAVMLSMMALHNGARRSTVVASSKELLMVLREGAQAEVSSWVSKDAYRIIRALDGIEKDGKGQPLVSPEIVIVFKIPKKDNPKGSNVIMRGVTSSAFDIHTQVKLLEGQMFRPGMNEVIVSRRIRDRFVNTSVGDTFRFGPQDWKVVGVFDAGDSPYASEMWTDVDYLGQARKRNAYSSLFVKPAGRAGAESIKAAIKDDNRLKLLVKSEQAYYEGQTNGLTGIVFLVGIVTFFMIIGAVLATMNVMFTAVSSRKRELATLRALGFRRRTIIAAILFESAIVGSLGGILGVLLSYPVNFISTGTTNWMTFSEVAFNFRVDARLALTGILIAVISGMVGGLLPAIGAARMPITRALREI